MGFPNQMAADGKEEIKELLIVGIYEWPLLKQFLSVHAHDAAHPSTHTRIKERDPFLLINSPQMIRTGYLPPIHPISPPSDRVRNEH